MDINELILSVYVTIDDELKIVRRPLRVSRLRQGGPKLSDAEVLTIECVGELLGLDVDNRVFAYFARHFRRYFPALTHTHRATFARQAASLGHIKGLLWHRLVEEVAPAADRLHIVAHDAQCKNGGTMPEARLRQTTQGLAAQARRP